MGKSLLLSIISIIAILSSSNAYAVTYPVSTPSGEYTGGEFNRYFTNMFSTPCSGGQVISGFTSTGVLICVASAGYWSSDNAGVDVYRSSGKVGIGTAIPSTQLEVTAAIPNGTYNGVRISNSSYNNGGRPSLELFNSNASGNFASARIWSEIGNSGINPSFGIDVADGSRVLQNRIIINKNGNVGIGTTPSISYPLEVEGEIKGTRIIAYGSGNITSNTAIGRNSLLYNSIGTDNTAIGVNTLLSNTTGITNTAIGINALRSNTDGSYNTAVGSNALDANTTGSGNTAFGRLTLTNNTIGSYNSAIGYFSLTANTTGIGNIALGYSSLSNNTTGSYNVGMGRDALNTNTSGNNNTTLGYRAGYALSTGDNNIALGANTDLPSSTASNQLNIGNWIYGSGGNIGIGVPVPTAKFQVNADALINGMTIGLGSGNINTNTAVGKDALYTYGTGSDNTAVGRASLYSNTLGEYNTAIGRNALYYNTVGSYNTALGSSALLNNITGSGNIGIGRLTLANNTSGSYNSAVGYLSLTSNSTGSSNIAVGYSSLSQNEGGSRNTGMGRDALNNNLSGNDNTTLGYRAGYNLRSGNYSIAIGSDTDFPSTTASNQLNIGNWIYGSGGNIGIGVPVPTVKLDIAGSVKIASGGAYLDYRPNNIACSSGQILSWDSVNNRWICANDAMGITGGGLTANYVTKWNGGALANTQLFDDGTNIGLGTTTPSTRLEIAGPSATDSVLRLTNTDPTLVASQQLGALEFYSSDVSPNGTGVMAKVAAYTNSNAGQFGNIGIFTALDSTSLTESLTVHSNGNVGIGTTTPTTKLTVSGSALVTGDITVQGRVITDTIVNRSVANVSISGSLLPDSGAPLVYRDIGSSTQRWNNLYLSGQITMAGGSPGLGKVLTSNATGLATWQSPSDWTLTGNAGTTAGTNFLGTTDNIDLVFKRNNIEGMRISGTGANLVTTADATINGVTVGRGGGNINSNVAYGSNTFVANTGGNFNTAYGVNTLTNNTTGWYNVADGYSALSTNTTGYGNTANGYQALLANSTGSYNVAIGFVAGNTITTGSSNITIGNNAQVPSNTASNQLSLGNLIYGTGMTGGGAGNIGIGISNPTVKLEVGGSVKIATAAAYLDYRPNNSACSTGQILSWDNTNTRWICSNDAIGVTGSGLTTNYITKWNGSVLANSQLFDNGTSVGIGTASPGAKLDVQGNARFGIAGVQNGDTTIANQLTVAHGTSGGADLTVTSSAPTGGSALNIGNTGTSGNNWRLYVGGNNVSGGGGTAVAEGNLQIINTTDALTRLFIAKSTGNVGIGTSTPTAKLEVTGDALFNSVRVGRGNGNITTNTAIGSGSLTANTTGSQNTANGMQSLQNNLGGSNNTANGYSALFSNTTGNSNTAHGNGTLYNNSTGSNNTSVGYQALYNTITGNNTAVGYQSLYNNISGLNNTTYGYRSLLNNASGSFNVAVGLNAGSNLTSGDSNIFLGYNVQAGISNTGSNQLNIGNWIYGDNGNIGLGDATPATRLELAGSQLLIKSYDSTTQILPLIASQQLGAIEFYANDTNTNGTGVMAKVAAYANSNVGQFGNIGIFTGLDSSSVAENFTVHSNGNVGIGITVPTSKLEVIGDIKAARMLAYGSGDFNNNSAVGYNSLLANTTGTFNTADGANTLTLNTTGTQNTAIGYNGLYNNSTGSFNTTLGVNALFANTVGSSNVANGVSALSLNTTGSGNSAFGRLAGSTITTGSNNTALGYNAQIPTATGSNQVRVGDTNVTYAGVQVAWTITSDQRWKDQIQDLGYGLDFVEALHPVSYIRKDVGENAKKEYGFIAQDVEKVFEQFGDKTQGMLTKTDKGYLELRYNDFFAPIVKAIQELSLMNRASENKIKALESENRILRSRLDAIEQKLGM